MVIGYVKNFRADQPDDRISLSNYPMESVIALNRTV